MGPLSLTSSQPCCSSPRLARAITDLDSVRALLLTVGSSGHASLQSVALRVACDGMLAPWQKSVNNYGRPV